MTQQGSVDELLFLLVPFHVSWEKVLSARGDLSSIGTVTTPSNAFPWTQHLQDRGVASLSLKHGSKKKESSKRGKEAEFVGKLCAPLGPPQVQMSCHSLFTHILHRTVST